MAEVFVLIGAVLMSLGSGLLIWSGDDHDFRPWYFTGLTLMALGNFARSDPGSGTILGALAAALFWQWWNDEDQRRRRRKLRDVATARIVEAAGRLMVVRPVTGQP